MELECHVCLRFANLLKYYEDLVLTPPPCLMRKINVAMLILEFILLNNHITSVGIIYDGLLRQNVTLLHCNILCNVW